MIEVGTIAPEYIRIHYRLLLNMFDSSVIKAVKVVRLKPDQPNQ